MAFTGSREPLTLRQYRAIHRDLLQMPEATGFVTGACIGLDVAVGDLLLRMYPCTQHTVVVPADRSRIKAWWRSYPASANLTVIEMPPGTDYRDRNARMISLSSVLVGYPQYERTDPRSRRSGSWQTIRMAEQMHKVRPVVRTLEGM